MSKDVDSLDPDEMLLLVENVEGDDVNYLARELENAEKLSDTELTALRRMDIRLRHKVLPQHDIESCAGTRPPKPSEVEKIAKIINIKKGVFDAGEDQLIVHNWKAFCKLHHWSNKKVKPFLLLRQNRKAYIPSKRKRRLFVQFLADGLPNRTLYSVYHRFRNLYAQHLQRRYQPDEDQLILDHLQNNPNIDAKRKYADLAKVLKRTRASIWRRYRILKKTHGEEDW